MARLIDAKALKKVIMAEPWKDQINAVRLTEDYINIIIDEQPPVDAVEVVRCKDCILFCPEEIRKLYDTEKYCMRTGWLCNDDDFCSYGERRIDVNRT